MSTYDLKYNDYDSNVSDGFRSLLATSDISDITLAVEGKFFQAHQVILSIFSPYFRELFCVHPSKHTIFFMKNVKYRIMHNLLAFMYEGMVQIPKEDFNLFCETANELKIKGLSMDGEPHSKAKVTQVPVESAPVVGIDPKQSRNEHSQKPARCLKRTAKSVQASPAGAAKKKSKVGVQGLHEIAPEVNVLTTAVPSTSWDPAPLECVQEVLPIIVNVTGSSCMQTVDTIGIDDSSSDATCDIKLEPEEVPVNTLQDPLGDLDVRHIGANEGHSAPYEPAPSTSWNPAPHECAQEDLPTFVNVTGDTNIHTKEEVDSYSEEDTPYSMHNEDTINSGGYTTSEIKWEPEDASDDNLLVPLCDADAGHHGDNEIHHEDATNMTLNDRSKDRYEQKYSAYCTWRSEYGASRTTEDVFIAYLTERSKHINPSSLWAENSMLKTMIKLRENVDVKEMHKVKGFIKRNTKEYTPKKSRTLTNKECMQFLTDAPDEIFLMKKVALIIGIYGACRNHEMVNLKVEHLKVCDDYLKVTVQQPTNLIPRTFTVPNSTGDGIQLAEFVKRYISLRPADIPHKRLFIYYAKGKCTTTPVGRNTFAKIPANIAQYLNLPDAKLYTGHCFRRTATSLANAVAKNKIKINISDNLLRPGSDSD